MAINGKFLKDYLPVILIAIGIVTGWLSIQFKVNAICEADLPALKQMDRELDRADDMATAERNMMNQAIIKLQADVAHIKETVDRNYEVQQQILRELRNK